LEITYEEETNESARANGRSGPELSVYKTMRQVTITAPKGNGREIAEIAFGVGVSEVTVKIY